MGTTLRRFRALTMVEAVGQAKLFTRVGDESNSRRVEGNKEATSARRWGKKQGSADTMARGGSFLALLPPTTLPRWPHSFPPSSHYRFVLQLQ